MATFRLRKAIKSLQIFHVLEVYAQHWLALLHMHDSVEQFRSASQVSLTFTNLTGLSTKITFGLTRDCRCILKYPKQAKSRKPMKENFMIISPMTSIAPFNCSQEIKELSKDYTKQFLLDDNTMKECLRRMMWYFQKLKLPSRSSVRVLFSSYKIRLHPWNWFKMLQFKEFNHFNHA